MPKGWEAVIGLEVHVQLKTHAKLFSSAPNAFGAPPNSQTTEVDLGLPGVLPVLNAHAVELAVRAAVAVGDGSVGLTRIHMEEDAAKNIHDDAVTGGGVTHVDLNRAGAPLCEIVSEPEIHSPEEAGAYLRSLRQVLRY